MSILIALLNLALPLLINVLFCGLFLLPGVLIKSKKPFLIAFKVVLIVWSFIGFFYGPYVYRALFRISYGLEWQYDLFSGSLGAGTIMLLAALIVYPIVYFNTRKSITPKNPLPPGGEPPVL